MARTGIGSQSSIKAPYSVASRLVARAIHAEPTSADMRQVRVPTLTELGRITAVIVALIAFSALVAVAPSKVLIPLGVAFAAGLAASAVVALVGRYPRAIAAPITVPDASAHGTPPHSS